MFKRNQLIKELSRFNSLEKIRLVVHQDYLTSEMSIYVYDALKLIQMIPNSKTFYDYEKIS